MATVDPRDTENILKIVRDPMDDKTAKLLSKVANDINANNAKLGVDAKLYANPMDNANYRHNVISANSLTPINNIMPMNVVYSNIPNNVVYSNTVSAWGTTVQEHPDPI